MTTELVLTNACTHNCTYCYVDKTNIKNMDVKTFEHYLKAVDHFMEAYEMEEHHVLFYGGEPLLNWDMLKLAANVMADDSRTVKMTLHTNGYLLDHSKMDFLQKMGISTIMTFDGLLQDTTRPLASGRENLDYYRMSCAVTSRVDRVKVMLSKEMVPHLCKNFKYLVNEFGVKHPDFTLVTCNTKKDLWHGVNFECLAKELKATSMAVIDYFDKGINAIPLNYIHRMVDFIHGTGKLTCFAGKLGFAYTPQDKAFPCLRFAGRNEYPMYVKGQPKKNYLKLIDRRDETFFNNYSQCSTCEFERGCKSHCLYTQTTDNRKPHKLTCEVYKLIMEEVIFLFDKLKDNSHLQQMIRENLHYKR